MASLWTTRSGSAAQSPSRRSTATGLARDPDCVVAGAHSGGERGVRLLRMRARTRWGCCCGSVLCATVCVLQMGLGLSGECDRTLQLWM